MKFTMACPVLRSKKCPILRGKYNESVSTPFLAFFRGGFCFEEVYFGFHLRLSFAFVAFGGLRVTGSGGDVRQRKLGPGRSDLCRVAHANSNSDRSDSCRDSCSRLDFNSPGSAASGACGNCDRRESFL